MKQPKIYSMSFAKVYPLYVSKAEKKGRTQAEVDQVIRWMTGYTQKGLQSQIKKEVSFETFFSKAPKPNPNRSLVTGTICGVKVQDIKEPIMRDIRCLDKLVDELSKGKPMAKVLRS